MLSDRDMDTPRWPARSAFARELVAGGLGVERPARGRAVVISGRARRDRRGAYRAAGGCRTGPAGWADRGSSRPRRASGAPREKIGRRPKRLLTRATPAITSAVPA